MRIGGDEFVVLLPECDTNQVQLVLGRLANLSIELSPAKFRFVIRPAGRTTSTERLRKSFSIAPTTRSIPKNRRARKSRFLSLKDPARSLPESFPSARKSYERARLHHRRHITKLFVAVGKLTSAWAGGASFTRW